jgi:hypothetical protein
MREAAAVLVVFAGCACARAQESQPSKPEPPATSSPGASIPAAPTEATPPPRVQTQITFHGEHNFSADLDGSPGSVGIDRLGADVGVQVMVGDRSRLSLSLASEYSWYSFKNATGFATGFTEPWDDTIQTNLSATFSSQATRQWSWFAGAGIDQSIQPGAKFFDGFTGGLYGGASYSFSERFKLGLGAALRTRLEDNGEVLPIPVIEWQIADKWRLDTHAEIGGRGIELSYQPIEPLKLTLDATYTAREFRLDDSAAAPEGVGRDDRVPISLGAEWNFSRQFAVSAHVGVDAWQEYTLVDSGGNKLSQINTKPDVFVGAAIVIRF